MKEGTYRYFIIGLKRAFKEAGYQYHKDFAEGIMNPVSFSKNMNGKHKMCETNILACAKKLNKEVSEIVLLGKQIESGQTRTTRLRTQNPGIQASYVNPMEVLTSVSALVHQYHKNDEQMHFWRAIFEALPVAVLIIKDKEVYYQNVKSREIGTHIGAPLCETCTSTGCDDKCKDCEKQGRNSDCICPISRAMRMAKATSGSLSINGLKRIVEVAPIVLQDHDYYIVVVSATLDDPGYDRRINVEDRRKGMD